MMPTAVFTERRKGQSGKCRQPNVYGQMTEDRGRNSEKAMKFDRPLSGCAPQEKICARAKAVFTSQDHGLERQRPERDSDLSRVRNPLPPTFSPHEVRTCSGPMPQSMCRNSRSAAARVQEHVQHSRHAPGGHRCEATSTQVKAPSRTAIISRPSVRLAFL
jgi:hypothetical protein